jgi:multidrug efflux pump subunit AcrB
MLQTDRREVIETLQQRAKSTSPSLYAFYQDKYMPVWFKEVESNRFSKFFLEQGQLQSPKSPLKPKDFSEIRLEKTSNALHKEDRQYIRTVGYEYFGSPRFGQEHLEEVLTKMRQSMPVGYTAEYKTFSFGFEQAKRQYSLLLLLLVAIFFICAILFESLRTPFLIISTIPVSYIGIFFTFGWFGFYFDQGGYAAFVLLGGIVVNASTQKPSS